MLIEYSLLRDYLLQTGWHPERFPHLHDRKCTILVKSLFSY